MNSTIISKIIFSLAAAALLTGIIAPNLDLYGNYAGHFRFASEGSVAAINGWYLLAGVLYAKAMAVRVVFGRPEAAP